MRLKRLYIHGFKTFAPKTELPFGEGLTAIVGPNGAGKSNVADAVRWVLGEQSLGQLRAKRTEDLIFAGSSTRAPLGMAEVSITIDNGDHLLPIDFAEVTLTRRAYRSGENEYYINKSRVRLRDVLDVAATLGQAYTVVGQGLVDAALSLRPEERRELFEEAAAIRGYFVQREDALKRLSRTEENTTRLSDLATELEPQVRRMERQARQAQEYKDLQHRLHDLLETWYSTRWLATASELRDAEQAEHAALAVVEARRASVAAKSAELAEARSRVWKLVDEVSALHEQRAQAQAGHAARSQSQAVLAERLAAASQQRLALSREQADLQTALDALASQSAQLQSEHDQRQSGIAAQEEAGREVAAGLAEMDARHEALERDRRQCAGEVEAAARKLAGIENRLLEGRRRRAEQEAAITEAEAGLASLGEKIEAEEQARVERETAVAAAQQGISAAEQDLSDAQDALRAARAARSKADERMRELTREWDGLGSQLAALTGEQQAGLYAGVRAVVAAAKQNQLTGYVGTVAELLRVPPKLEAAIEAALGGRLQDVVVSSWADAERAIAFLKRSGAGRATFLPLDTLRAAPVPTPPKAPGIMGLARDMVAYDPSLGTLADNLLGRVLIVEDLRAARQAISGLQPNAPWTLATLGGEVVRPGGSVTGGSNVRTDDSRGKSVTLLGRERRRRELQSVQDALAEEIKATDRTFEDAIATVHEHEARLAHLSGLLEEARKRHMAAQMVHVDQQGSVSRLRQESAWRTGLLSESHKTLQGIADFEDQATSQKAAIEAGLAPARERLAAIEAEIGRLLSERAGIAGAAGAGNTRLAVLAEGLRNVSSRLDEVRAETARLQNRQSELEDRLQAAAAEETALTQQREQHAEEVTQLASRLRELEEQVGPSEHQVKLYEAEVSRIEAEHSALQESLLESDTQYSRAAVEKQRCIGALESLRIEVSEELGATQESAAQPAPAETPEGAAEQTSPPEPPWVRWEVAWSATLQAHETAPGNPSPGNGFLKPDPSPTGVGAPLAAPHDPSSGETGAPSERSDAAPSAEAPSSPAGSHPGHPETASVDNTELERQVYALKAKLSRLGPVNPLAMEEHAALVERHDYLRSQLSDLDSAAEALRRVIGELDRTMREQFAATFSQVNEAFTQYFTTLFGGGMARLELTNPEDVAASGVELMAQPPGKRMQPLAALSGGERALTSAALLFALLKVRPVPFCVLDEVDAALDESNVTRFRDVLQELEARTQFVIITHNRGTIEAADTLFGVSMAGDGTSQVLSLAVGAKPADGAYQMANA